MRSTQEMLDLIIEVARQDERIRAVIMNGSRVNPNARPDIFQDFDIVYIVTDIAPFWSNRTWIKRFGERMILQMPEEMQDPPPCNDGTFVYLMQFTDGNRIDLTLCPCDKLDGPEDDSLSVLLLDKDGIITPFGPPTEKDYLPKPPTCQEYDDCCNEFWWVCTLVAKGLWREELPYAKYMLDQILREQLTKMVVWHIGVETGFSSNPGKAGRHFRQFLQPPLWALLEKTYADATYPANWEALYAMCALFRKVALPTAARFGFVYPHADDERVSAHLKHVRGLPKDAMTMY